MLFNKDMHCNMIWHCVLSHYLKLTSRQMRLVPCYHSYVSLYQQDENICWLSTEPGTKSAVKVCIFGCRGEMEREELDFAEDTVGIRVLFLFILTMNQPKHSHIDQPKTEDKSLVWFSVRQWGKKCLCLFLKSMLTSAPHCISWPKA